MEFNTFLIEEVANFRSDKISAEAIENNEYISTENMIADKKGVIFNGSKPQSGNVNRFFSGDILISNIRPYFKKIWFSDREGAASPDVLIFQAKEKIVLPKFLYYVLSNDIFFDYMVKTSKGTKMPRGDKAAILKYEVKIPSISNQYKISNILSIIDEKISVNNSLILSLENISDVLFKRWFIDFDFPNIQGFPYRSNEGGMIESEIGDIPEGWKIRSLDSIANYKNGLAMQKYRPKDGEDSLPVLKIKELNQGYTSIDGEKCSINIPDSVKVSDGDVIFSWSGTLMVKLWAGGNAGLNQHLFKVTSEEFSKWFYYLWTKHHLREFVAIAESKATTMGHIKRTHLAEARVLIPNEKLFSEAEDIFTPIINEIINFSIENKKLIEMRDNLLPKLLSGEIEIPDESVVES